MPSTKVKLDRAHATLNRLIQELRNEGQYAHVPDDLPDDGDDTRTCTWDVTGRMVSATVGGTTTTYACDHEGIRVGQTTGAPWRNPTGCAKVIEEHASGNPRRSSVLGLHVEGRSNPAGPAWFIRDAHGSNRLLANADAAIAGCIT